MRAAMREQDGGERPRERLLARGAAALTTAELVAVALRSGVAGRPALVLAHDLLAHFGSAGALVAAEPTAIGGQPGVGPARAAALVAAVELVRRALAEEAAARDVLTSPEAVRDYLITKGVAAGRIETRGADANEPLASNKSGAGRARNRRVELTLLSP